MSLFYFQTIEKSSEGLFKEKGSKFLAFAFPVRSEEEVKEQLEKLRKKYFDARHHCYAWVLGPRKTRFRANDDGEPNHSAGDPILGQIRSRDLTDVLVVVVRYFGGTKLGVSGLIQAYRTAADEALSNAEIIRKELTVEGRFNYPYASTTEVQRLMKDFDLVILQQEFGEACALDFQLKQSLLDLFLEKVNLLQSTGTILTLELDKSKI